MIRPLRSVGTVWQATIGTLALLPALPLAAAQPAAGAAAPQHGGGGFALLLLDYRQGFEGLIVALRQGAAELAAGAAMAPAEMMGAWHRVTAGGDPLLLVAALAAILGAGFPARHALRRRLAGGSLEGPSDVADGFGLRLARAATGCWSICSGSAPSPSWRSCSRRWSRRRPVRRAA